jgi:predicted MFS family arabinose efflux permease
VEVEMTTTARYRLLAAVYGSQFIPLAFCLFALGAILRHRGIALELIAIVQLAALVWVVKFAWAPLVDRYGSRRLGHYRGWLIATQLAMVAGALALIPLDVVANLPMVLAVVAFVAIVSATQDIAADAAAVRLLAPTERGIGNGIQKAGGYLGLMIGGGAGLVLYDWWGWGPTLAVLAALTALPLPMLLRYREPAGAAPDPAGPAVSLRTLASFFQQPGAARWALAVLPASLAGIALAYPLVNPLLVDAGWPLATVGAVSVIGGGGVAVVASLAAGALLSTTGRRRALVGLAVAQAAAISALVLAVATDGTLLAMAAVGLLSGASAAAGTAAYTINMDWSRPSSAGTDFTLQDSLAHLYQHIAGPAALALAGAFGYAAVLSLAAVVAIAGVAVVARLYQDRLTRCPPDPCAALRRRRRDSDAARRPRART